MSLVEYKKKRKFNKTPEPAGKREHSDEPIFVIQKHDASHLHYDFRLEMDGVLKSWAVPKGPPLKAKEKRLAVEVEDHPVSYADFEGDIPEGEYGAGHVEIWDHGTWGALGTPKNPLEQLKKGHIEFELKGEKLKGKWMLVRTQMKGKKANWLLIKRSGDQFLETKTKKPLTAKALKSSTKKQKIAQEEMPEFIEPALCTLVDEAPVGPNWIHEIKYDGYRTLARIEGKSIKLLTRSGLDWSHKYRSIQAELKKLEAESAIIDGEIVWIDETGRSQFDGLQNSLKNGDSKDLIFYAFDLLFLNGEDLQDRPLKERKLLLEHLIDQSKLKKIIYSSHQKAPGKNVLSAACDLKLEGIICKDINSPYQSGRAKEWLKVKCKNVQEFVIGGYTFQKESNNLGALLMGYYNDKNDFVYVGRVGTGFNHENSKDLMKKLKKLEADSWEFKTKPPQSSGVTWVRPKLVANVEFGAWTAEKILRHAAFKGLREDKKPVEVKAEKAAPLEKIIKSKASTGKKTGKKQSASPVQAESDVKLTHPEKLLFKKEKISKQNIADYYSKIYSHFMLHAKDRPLSLLRCQNGEGKPCFFQKHLPDENLISISTLRELMELVQINALELHAQNCHIDALDNPDQIIFDLDPDPGVSWQDVKNAAMELKDILDQLDLKSFIKVSGGKGLHIHVPFEPTYTWDEAKNFSRSVCMQMVQNNPDKYTINLLKKNRKGRIFLDYLRNGQGATAVLPYSVRSKPGAPLALPISWQSLKALKAPNAFSLADKKIYEQIAKNPWKDYFKTKQRIKVLDQSKKSRKKK